MRATPLGMRLFAPTKVAGGLGPELATNGDFTVSTGWSVGSGVTISGGVCTVSSGAGYGLFRSASIVSGHVYRFQGTVSGYSTGLAIPYVGSNGTLTAPPWSANGSFSQDMTADSAGELGFGFNTGFTATLDNISVKEVL